MKAHYSVVRFSPNPEEIEPANVALLLCNGRNDLIFDESFPKLTCIAPQFDKSILTHYLTHLRSTLERAGGDAPRLVREASAQFSVTPPREILAEQPLALVPMLMERYLARGTKKHREKGRSQYIQSRLQEFLVDKFKLPEELMRKRAAPRDFLDPGVVSRLPAQDFKITRVVLGDEDLLAVDAVDVENPASYLNSRATMIGYGFYQLGKVKDPLERIEKRHLSRAVVLLGNEDRMQDPHVEFAVQSLRSSSEFVFPWASPSPDFRRAAYRAASSARLV